MPGRRRHKEDTKDSNELNFGEQARSINAHIVQLQQSICRHLKRAESEGRDVGRVRDKCINQLRRLLARVTKSV
ncbi:MAG: hypothetical protein ABSF45_18490 [Terriglobia bacterium]|jgi:hypothetical protein